MIVVIGGGYWAKGETLPEAKKAFTSYGGRLSRGYGVVTFGPGSEFKGVDDFGRYHWTGEAPTVTEVPARKSR